MATRKSTRLRFPTKINNIEQVNESKRRLSRDFSCVASKKSFVKTEIVESISCSPKVSASLSNDKIMSSSLSPTSPSIVTFVGGAGSGGSFNTKQDKPSPRRQSLRSNNSKNYNITEIIRHKCIRSLEFSTPSSSDTQSKQVNKKTSAQDNSQGTSASGSTNQGEGHDESFGGSSQSSDGSKKGRTPKRRRSSRKSEDGTLPFQKDWVCVLCGLGNNERNLGYLFGPYELSEGTKNEEKKETWVHCLCATWTPGVCLVGSEVKGLEEAIEEGKTMSCSKCKHLGATMTCHFHTCKIPFHYPCAVDECCEFNSSQFTITCPRHSSNATS